MLILKSIKEYHAKYFMFNIIFIQVHIKQTIVFSRGDTNDKVENKHFNIFIIIIGISCINISQKVYAEENCNIIQNEKDEINEII